MGHPSVKKFASSIKKKRFTVKFSDGKVFRTGTCREEEDERFGIEFQIIAVGALVDGKKWDNGFPPERAELVYETKFFLTQYQLNDIDYSQPPKERTLLPDGALVANGYYEAENDEFVSPSDWLKQE